MKKEGVEICYVRNVLLQKERDSWLQALLDM